MRLCAAQPVMRVVTLSLSGAERLCRFGLMAGRMRTSQSQPGSLESSPKILTKTEQPAYTYLIFEGATGVAFDSDAPTNAYSLLMTILGWLGMTPSDRSRIAATPMVGAGERGEL